MATIAEALEKALYCHRAGNLYEAEQLYLLVLQAQPQHAEALHYLGVIAYQMGRHDQAIVRMRQALALNPRAADCWSNLGLVCQAMGHLDEAVDSFRRSLQIEPQRMVALVNLGDTLRAQGKLDEAADCCRQILLVHPELPECHNNLGVLLHEQGLLVEAIACFEQALALRPGFPPAVQNLESARLAQQELGSATPEAKPPERAEALNDQGRLLQDQGRMEEALAAYDEALGINPNLAEAHVNRALLRLLGGDFERGWPELEWRQRCKGVTPRSFPRPTWDGSPLQGRTILLHAEPGLEDTIQFARYAALVKQRGGQVVIECEPALLELLVSCAGAAAIVARGSPLPPFEVHAPLLSLPAIFGTTLATVPATVPYLTAPSASRERWQRELGSGPGLRIGLVWQSDPAPRRNASDSIPLARFASLSRLPGARLISLQQGAGAGQLKELAGQFELHDLGPAMQTETWTWADTAAVVANLDLVIGVHAPVVHVAGALGIPVWTAIASPPNWRWLLERQDSPWYPTMRLFRQSQPGDWDSVVWRMTEAAFERLLQS